MMIKSRHFNVEKMSQFLGEKNNTDPIPIGYSLTPAHKSKKLINKPQSFSHDAESIPKPTPKPAKKNNKSAMGAISKVSTQSMEELPVIVSKTPKRSLDAIKVHVPSQSTPRVARSQDIVPIKHILKKPDLYFDKHIEKTLIEEVRKNMIDYQQIRTFNDKYAIQFQEIKNINGLDRCLEMLNTENDRYILEDVVPGKFGENTIKPESSQQNLLPSISDFSKNTRSRSNFDGSFTPVHYGTKDLKDLRSERADLSTPSTIMSNASINYTKLQMPKVEMSTFAQSFSTLKQGGNNGIFLVIKANNQGYACELGFCEVLFSTKKKNYACVTKFFITRAYRKMRMVLPIALKLTEHLFKSLGLEKLSVRMLAENTFAQNDLRILGYKLEKIGLDLEKKTKLFSMKKEEFDEIMENLANQKKA